MFLLIVNSSSGQSVFKDFAQKLTIKLDTSFVPYFTHDYQEDDLWVQVKSFIKEKKSGLSGIVVVGGDGTLHRAINELFQYNLPFGLVPAGSGNDFAKALNIPLQHEKAFTRILTRTPDSYDLIKVNNHLVLSVAGVGIDAETAARTRNSSLKKWLNRIGLGKLSYLITFIAILGSFTPYSLELTQKDGQKHIFTKVWLTAVGNTPFYGGGIPVCPQADPQDGLMDVTVVHRLSWFKLLLVLPAVFFKFHTKLPYVTCHKTKQMTVTTKAPVLTQGDGELIGHTPLEISILPRSIRFF
ncbi:diacylglycerol kinase family lipid kinase [Salipaludibacillus sp. CUR1]|uniref:diacylglycerol/lipid kinase family protein n=1 Tax=Salipaludibacillus sp. CUR1 TaxID=2820003 RepID=UPI001E2BBE96|nr:diacylglycerol kinase family protein [Salipaludibacillus sp. CUR1]MCE7792104.1 diacylglycerol kinase family lipid kinase [Salipaludibacillus sp. CUR1]